MGLLKNLFGQKKTTPETTTKRRERSYPDFPEGGNHIDDPDVKTVADLARYYPLPNGYEYRVRADGSLYMLRPSDGMEFKIVVEEGLLTFEEPFTRTDGTTGSKTIEVFKR